MPTERTPLELIAECRDKKATNELLRRAGQFRAVDDEIELVDELSRRFGVGLGMSAEEYSGARRVIEFLEEFRSFAKERKAAESHAKTAASRDGQDTIGRGLRGGGKPPEDYVEGS